MGFYDLPKPERDLLAADIYSGLLAGWQQGTHALLRAHYGDADTYIRKTAYLATGRIYFAHPELQPVILDSLKTLLRHEDFRVRQTVINAAGEIARKDFETVQFFFDTGLFDAHHSPRNAVIGSIKKAGEVNPQPVLAWAAGYLTHPDKEIRREICHGIELRGRRHPEDILPLLQQLEWDPTARVRNTLVHVLGQIAYKKGCLATVAQHLQQWQNKSLVTKALAEIIDVHDRYRNFAALSQQQAREYLADHFPG